MMGHSMCFYGLLGTRKRAERGLRNTAEEGDLPKEWQRQSGRKGAEQGGYKRRDDRRTASFEVLNNASLRIYDLQFAS